MELQTPPAFILRLPTSGLGSSLNRSQGFFISLCLVGVLLQPIELGQNSFPYHQVVSKFVLGLKELRWRQSCVTSSKKLCFRFFAKIAEKGRRAWSANTCLSTTTRPQTVNWSDDVNSLTMQGIVDIEARNGTKSLEMQCFPLFTLLLALGSPTVDFLSLDIEVF